MPNQLIPVAIADDHGLYREALTTLINSTEKFTVIIEVKNGKELLDKLNGKIKPVIILLDMSMPVMNGFDTFKELQKKLPQAKVLVISGYSNMMSVLLMKKAGCHGYLSKNASGAEIKEAMEKVYTTGEWFPMTKNEKAEFTSTNQVIQNLEKLTPKEITFLHYVNSDLSYKEIAKKMNVTRYTIDDYRDALFTKFNVSTRHAMVMIYVKYYLSQTNNVLPDHLV